MLCTRLFHVASAREVGVEGERGIILRVFVSEDYGRASRARRGERIC